MPGRYGAASGREGEAVPAPPPAATAAEFRSEPGDINVVWRRAAQYIIDSVVTGIAVAIVITLAFAVFIPLGIAPGQDGALAPWAEVLANTVFAVLAIAVFLAYWALVPALSVRGQTPGMMLMGIRIIRGDGSRVSGARHLVRVLMFIVDGFLYGLVGLAIILGSKRNQRLGDMVADTLVVRTRD